jgi:hypothetical protein
VLVEGPAGWGFVGEDPHVPANAPEVMTVWRANLQRPQVGFACYRVYPVSLAKGGSHAYFWQQAGR